MKTAALAKYRARLVAARTDPFADWDVTRRKRAACTRALVAALDALVALGPRGRVEDATAVLKRCVERFNRLDDGFICTVEREELCDVLYDIGELCGLDSSEEWVEEWREW